MHAPALVAMLSHLHLKKQQLMRMEKRAVRLVEPQKEKLLMSFLRMKTTYLANCLAFKNAIILFNNPLASFI